VNPSTASMKAWPRPGPQERFDRPLYSVMPQHRPAPPPIIVGSMRARATPPTAAAMSKLMSQQVELARLRQSRYASENARLQKARDTAAKQQARYEGTMHQIELFNNRRRICDERDPADLQYQLTRLGAAAANDHMAATAIAVAKAVAKARTIEAKAISTPMDPANAYARDYSKDGLEPDKARWWAMNEARMISYVSYDAAVPDTPLIFAAPIDTDFRLRLLRQRQQRQQQGLLIGDKQVGTAAFDEDVVKPTLPQPDTTKYAMGRHLQQRSESPRSPKAAHRAKVAWASTGSAVLPRSPSQQKFDSAPRGRSMAASASAPVLPGRKVLSDSTSGPLFSPARGPRRAIDSFRAKLAGR